MNFGAYPTVNGLTRLQSRFLDEPGRVDDLKGRTGAGTTLTGDLLAPETVRRMACETRCGFGSVPLLTPEVNNLHMRPKRLSKDVRGPCTP